MSTTALLGTLGGAVLLFMSTVIGLLLKDRADKRTAANEKASREAAATKEEADRKAAAQKTRDELEAKRAQEVYDQMQEDLAAARNQLGVMQENMTGLQRDLNEARGEMGRMWSQMTTMRRELDAAEAHIEDVHRWDAGGRQGPMPQRKTSV